MRRADNLANFMCRVSRNSGDLTLVKTSGTAQACRGSALPTRDVKVTVLCSTSFKVQRPCIMAPECMPTFAFRVILKVTRGHLRIIYVVW